MVLNKVAQCQVPEQIRNEFIIPGRFYPTKTMNILDLWMMRGKAADERDRRKGDGEPDVNECPQDSETEWQSQKEDKRNNRQVISVAWIVQITGGMAVRRSHSRLHPAGEAA
jgi:hypothetical protein